MQDEDDLTHVFALLRDLDQKILEHGIRLDKIEFRLKNLEEKDGK